MKKALHRWRGSRASKYQTIIINQSKSMKDILFNLETGIVFHLRIGRKSIWAYRGTSNAYTFSDWAMGYKMHIMQLEENGIVIIRVGKRGNFLKPQRLSYSQLTIPKQSHISQ